MVGRAEVAAIPATLVQTEMLVTPVPMAVVPRLVLRVAPAMLVQTGMQETQVLMVRALRQALREVRVMLAQTVMLEQARQTAMSAIPVTRGTRQLLVT